MNKIIRIFGVYLIISAILLSFVGCGNKGQNTNTMAKYTEDELYSIMVENLNTIPQVDCTIESVNEDMVNDELSVLDTLLVFNNSEKQLYYKSTSKDFDKLNEMTFCEIEEIWVIEDENNNVEYRKLKDLQNPDDVFTSAKLVSDNHAYNEYVKDVYKWQSVKMLFPSSLSEFKKYIDEELSICNEVYEKTIDIGLKDEECVFSAIIKAEINEGGANNLIEENIEIIFTEKGINNMQLYGAISNNGKIVVSNKIDCAVTYNFDTSKFATLNKNEFKDVELQNEYSVKKNLIINDKTELVRFFVFNANVISTVSAYLKDYKAVFSFYSDADCKNRISATEKFASYESTIYCKAMPEPEYALILFYGEHNSVMTTNKNYINLTDTDMFIYKVNGEEISGNVLEIEPNKTYYIETVYKN